MYCELCCVLLCVFETKYFELATDGHSRSAEETFQISTV